MDTDTNITNTINEGKKLELEILSKVTGISVEELEYKIEVQIIRPSEAMEAMDELLQRLVDDILSEQREQRGLDD